MKIEIGEVIRIIDSYKKYASSEVQDTIDAMVHEFMNVEDDEAYRFANEQKEI